MKQDKLEVKLAKANRIKNIVIIILSVLLTMSVFLHIVFGYLLGVHNLETFKRAMLANELFSTQDYIEQEDVNNTEPVEEATEITEQSKVDDVTSELETGRVLLDAAGIKITLLGLEYDSFWECSKLKLMIENNSEYNVMVTSDKETIDGYMVDSIGFYREVLAGKKAVDYFAIYNFDLEEIGITQPKAINFTLQAIQSEDVFNTIAETSVITVELN